MFDNMSPILLCLCQ